jgi:hypothetical protein
MPFVDGEPIDAAKLGALETELNLLRSQMPKISSGQSININNSTTTNQVVSSGPTIFAKNDSTKLTLKPGTVVTHTVDMQAAGFSKAPTVVISTRSATTTDPKKWHPAFRVVSGSITATSFGIFCPVPIGVAEHSVYVSFIAIAT